ncbi:hypothetical protein BGZ47_001364 [Haplosporangium gracile]|nr:hypothetical protein BGZ47_001364 [Haplosporangium gracile]
MSIEALLNNRDEEVDDFYEQDEEEEDEEEEDEEEEELVRRRHLPESEQPGSDSEDDSTEAPTITTREVSAMLESVELFFQQQDGDYASFLASLRKMADTVDVIRDRSLKQSHIRDFFTPDKGKQKQNAKYHIKFIIQFLKVQPLILHGTSIHSVIFQGVTIQGVIICVLFKAHP